MKHQILGLLEIRKHRGLAGIGAREAWIMDAIEILLRCELEREEMTNEKSREQHH
jgi:hypothetical protein